MDRGLNRFELFFHFSNDDNTFTTEVAADDLGAALVKGLKEIPGAGFLYVSEIEIIHLGAVR